MKAYIVTREPYEQFTHMGNSLGMSDKKAVFYSPGIGRHRFYRQSMTNPTKGLKLVIYKQKKRADDLCKLTNEVHETTAWKVEEYTPPQMAKS